MSGKIKSKDLTYDSNLPPFLQRLHAKNTGYGPDNDPDRHERQVARPKKAKNPDDDDGPTVVDETGEEVSNEKLQELTKEQAPDETAGGTVTGELDAKDEAEASGALPDDHENVKPKEVKAVNGAAAKKRKAAKVVGQDEDVEDEVKDERKPAKKSKKKGKPVKLAFDED
ncbi:hypothetical protein B0A48_16599 [Cryoendolithus antarcticus]|uniref:DUF4604 domain-containing protein n=1 Tax=Cryoendolithus antarcticus TaxID=1507870 RepID=A0A1V8SEP4_9PEZI|nr:hypothetical protein B0A48_16599 [Cryoendolithus antarcticus]